MTEGRIICWHFVGDTLRDGSPVPAVGETISVEGRIKCCPGGPGEAGLHGSERIMDALQYAPGQNICRVEVWGDVVRGHDKLAGRRRRIISMINGEDLLWHFARQQALNVAHLWDMPPVVRRYLETGQEDIRDAARDAASGAAWDAARAARYVARDAAKATAWAAARGAAWYAARDAAWTAARAAAEATALDAANDMLTEMVEAAMQEAA